MGSDVTVLAPLVGSVGAPMGGHRREVLVVFARSSVSCSSFSCLVGVMSCTSVVIGYGGQWRGGAPRGSSVIGDILFRFGVGSVMWCGCSCCSCLSVGGVGVVGLALCEALGTSWISAGRCCLRSGCCVGWIVAVPNVVFANRLCSRIISLT